MTIFYHSVVGFCVGEEKNGVPRYWNPNRRAWETCAVDCWEKDLSVLIKNCYPEIHIQSMKTLKLFISHLG
jgi:hypothetical protein